MDYEKEYKKRLDAARYWHSNSEGGHPHCVRRNLSELHESGDEKIRCFLIDFVKINDGVNIPPDYAKKVLAWLEKLKVFAEYGDGLYHFGNNTFTYVGNPTCSII